MTLELSSDSIFLNSSLKFSFLTTASFSALVLPVLVMATAENAQAQNKDRFEVKLTAAQSTAKRQRDRQLRYQNLKKITRYPTPRSSTPERPSQSAERLPRPSSPTPIDAKTLRTYSYFPPTAAPGAIGNNRPICFIERSDGTLVDLSEMCGIQKTDTISRSRGDRNPFSNPNNADLPSYPFYPGDQPR